MQGVVSTLHQVMWYQSPDGKYTIDIMGDQTKCGDLVYKSDKVSTSSTQEEEPLISDL